MASDVARRLLAFLLLCGLQTPAGAAVEIGFYSREMGDNHFPHAFVSLRGRLETTGEPVNIRYGFTARSVGPALLFGSVGGDVVVEGEQQIVRSDRQFALTLTDDQYRALLEVVEAWRRRPQPSYNLDRRNCLHFVGELAQAVGLRVDYPGELMRTPRAFLRHVRALNPQLNAAR